MVTLPIRPVVMPRDLASCTNGNIHDHLLAPCGIGNFRMHHLAARAMRALVAAATSAGHIVRATGTTRTYPQQEDLFRSRYAIGATGGGCKLWDSNDDGLRETWCKIDSRLATAAVPGTSNHGWALAIDFAEELDGDPQVEAVSPDFVAWLVDHAHEYGYSAELQSEPWHWRYIAGDAIPAAVLAFERPAPPLPQNPVPVDPDPSEEDDDMATALKRYRDRRYQNIWLIPFKLHLSGEADKAYADDGVPLIEGEHEQMLDDLLHASGLTRAALVPR